MKKIKILSSHDFFKLSELKQLSDDEIKEKCDGIIVNLNSINENQDLFRRCVDNVGITQFCCQDYESALLIERYFKKYKKADGKVAKISLIDDNKMMDRSYIDVTQFDNIIIPCTYVMWGVKYDDKINISRNTTPKGVPSPGASTTYYYDRETISECERLASMISEFPEPLTDVEKVIIISNYMQKYFQFINGTKDNEVKGEYYVLNDENAYPRQVNEKVLGDPKTALFHNFGVCRTFADVTTLLSNNPYLKLKVGIVYGENHVWNTIELNGKIYQIDNSRAISRGENRMPNALKATKFNSEYLLFGQDTSKKIDHEQVSSNIAPISLENADFDRNYINAAIEHLKDTSMIDFEYSDSLLPYESHKK